MKIDSGRPVDERERLIREMDAPIKMDFIEWSLVTLLACIYLTAAVEIVRWALS